MVTVMVDKIIDVHTIIIIARYMSSFRPVPLCPLESVLRCEAFK